MNKNGRLYSLILKSIFDKIGGKNWGKYLLLSQSQILTNLVIKSGGIYALILKSIFDKIGGKKWGKYLLVS